MIRIIVAADLDNAIGREGKLPWRLRDDLRVFRRLTLGSVVVMGRRTYESIGRALSGRWNIVLTSDMSFDAPDIEVAHSLEDVLLHHKGKEGEVLNIIGGETLYRDLWNNVDEICLTRVLTHIGGCDAFVPPIDEDVYECAGRVSHSVDEDNEYPFEFQQWQRKSK